MCMNGGLPDFQTSSPNVTGFGSLGTTVQSTTSGNMAGGLSFGQTYALTSAVSGISKSIAAFKTGSAKKDSLMLAAQVQQANAEIIKQQKVDEKIISKKERDAMRRKHKRLGDGIVTDTAANNILLGGGSPLDALLSAEIYATADEGTAKVNEAGRVYGLDVKKFNADAQGDILQASAARISPGFDAFSTLLSTSTSNAFKYYNYKQSRITGLSTVRSALGLP
jgi:hypothetical protein